MKKLFSLLAIVLSSTGLGAHDFAVDGIYYNSLGGDSVEVTSNDGYYTYDEYGNRIWVNDFYSGNIVVPAQVAYGSTIYRVTSIGSSVFCFCPELTSITIPVSITSANGIGYECPKLTSIIWNAKRINEDDGYNIFAFYEDTECPVTSFIFGDEVEYIPSGLCQNMNKLTSITIPKNVKIMGNEVFRGCINLNSVVWNAKECNKERYQYNMFGYDLSITSFVIGNAVEYLPSGLGNGLRNITTLTIPKSVTAIGSETFNGASKLEQTNYTGDLASWCKIRFEGWGSSPTNSSHNLFIDGKEITGELIIPDGITTIYHSTFRGLDKLTKLSIPNSVTKIEEAAFGNCINLTEVNIGNGLDTLDVYAFYQNKSLKTFICQSTKAIEYFECEDEYKDAYFEDYAAEGAFLLCNKQLDSIVAPAQFFDLAEIVWSNLAKNLRYIKVNNGKLTADAFAVMNRSYKILTHLDLANTTNTEIADEAFKGSYKLETLLLPSQLERIGYMAVADCKNLQAIDIPATVTDIDDSAFENCRSIQTLTFGGQQPANAPHSKVETPFMASPQASQTSALQRIGNWAFYNCHELQHLEIPEGVTEIGAAAFYGCTYLEDLTLPATVQAIGDNCFALCSKLNKITCLATTPPTIEAKTFYDVKRSIPLYVPEASINDYANDTYWSEFINTQAAESTTGVERPFMRVSGDVRKVLENGQVILIRDGVRYNVLGVRL